jgi:hypothetical protein
MTNPAVAYYVLDRASDYLIRQRDWAARNWLNEHVNREILPMLNDDTFKAVFDILVWQEDSDRD